MVINIFKGMFTVIPKCLLFSSRYKSVKPCQDGNDVNLKKFNPKFAARFHKIAESLRKWQAKSCFCACTCLDNHTCVAELQFWQNFLAPGIL